MIELEAVILRGSCTPVFFAGETVECQIKFKHVLASSSSSSSGNNNKRASLQKKDSQQLVNGIAAAAGDMDDLDETNFINDESMFSMLSMSNSTSKQKAAAAAAAASQLSVRSNHSISFVSFDSLRVETAADPPPPLPEHTIAWSCVQIDCHCFIDESKVVLPKDPLRYSNLSNIGQLSGGGVAASDSSSTAPFSRTSFQPNKDRVGISVYSSKPKILFCNLTLAPNQTQSFTFREKLPYDLVPTFRGQFAKYAYKLTIGVQKLNKSIQLLRLPFRVFSLLDFDTFIQSSLLPSMRTQPDASIENEHVETGNLNIGGGSSNNNAASTSNSHRASIDDTKPSPFKIEDANEYDNLEFILQNIDDLTAPITSSTFNITSPDGRIGKITLSKTSYKIGEKLVAFIDFSEAQLQCVEFKVTLQSEEVISEECRKKTNQALSNIHAHVELKEHSLFLKRTDFTMQIPAHITPTFVSDIISLRWRLHFDFALSKTSTTRIHKSTDPVMSVSWHPASFLNVEVISWDLPIVIYPFDPFVASDLIYSNTPFNETNSLKIL